MSQHLEKSPGPDLENIVLICEKCGREEAKSLKKSLKEEIKATGLKGKTKIALTSCLSLCPKQGVTVAVLPKSERAQFYVAPEKATEQWSKDFCSKLA